MFKVLKKDGRVEDFDWKKLTGGVIKAGASEIEAEKVAREVETWLTMAAPEGTIASNDLHKKVIEVLKEVNAEAGARFESYKKPE